MSVGMAPRIRLVVDTDEPTRLAVRTLALDKGLTTSDIVNEILRAQIPDAIEAARKKIESRQQAQAAPAKRKREP